MIKTTTTVTFVTPRCFGGRHDDSEIVNDEREGLVMDGKERVMEKRERGSRRRVKRARGKGRKKMSDALGERVPLVHDRQR